MSPAKLGGAPICRQKVSSTIILDQMIASDDIDVMLIFYYESTERRWFNIKRFFSLEVMEPDASRATRWFSDDISGG